jgi:hypothetical protein
MPAHAVSLTAVFTYAVTYQEVGLPKGVVWGVTVAGTRYTSKTSSIIVKGLSGPIDDSYDHLVPNPLGGSYICVSGCIDTGLSEPFTLEATYLPYLGALAVTPVSPPTPPNGGTVTPGPVTLEVRVTAPDGSGVANANVQLIIFNPAINPANPIPPPSHVCSGSSDSNGYYSCSIDTTTFEYNSFSWDASAGKPGYDPGLIELWTFSISD